MKMLVGDIVLKSEYLHWPCILRHISRLFILKHLNIFLVTYEFKVLGKGRKLTVLLNNVLHSSNKFPVWGRLLFIVSELCISTAYCERGFSRISLIKTNHFQVNIGYRQFEWLDVSMNRPFLNTSNLSGAVDLIHTLNKKWIHKCTYFITLCITFQKYFSVWYTAWGIRTWQLHSSNVHCTEASHMC
jgi:hypothetical protein